MLVWGLAWSRLTPSLALYFPWASLFPSPNFPSRVWKIFSWRLEDQNSKPVCWSEVWLDWVWHPLWRCTCHELRSFHPQTFHPAPEGSVGYLCFPGVKGGYLDVRSRPGLFWSQGSFFCTEPVSITFEQHSWRLWKNVFCLSLVSLSPSALPWGWIIESWLSTKRRIFKILEQLCRRKISLRTHLHICLGSRLAWPYPFLGAVLAVGLAFTIAKLTIQSLAKD